MSNTKLTLGQKQTLKNLRALYPYTNIFHFPDTRVCVGVVRTGETMGEFSVALCSEAETKYRRKVGELLVRERFQFGQSLPVVLGPYTQDVWGYAAERDYLQSVADTIAAAVTGL